MAATAEILTDDSPEFSPGTRKRILRCKIVFYPCYRMVIEGNKMATLINVPCETRGKARTIAKRHIKNICK